MTMQELSRGYQESARVLRVRIVELRAQAQNQTNEEEAWRLRRRINTLTPILQEMRELAALTEHYYDRSYHKHEKYTL